MGTGPVSVEESKTPMMTTRPTRVESRHRDSQHSSPCIGNPFKDDAVVTRLPPAAQKQTGRGGCAVSFPDPHPSPGRRERAETAAGREGDGRQAVLAGALAVWGGGQHKGGDSVGLGQAVLLGMGQPSWGSRWGLGQIY